MSGGTPRPAERTARGERRPSPETAGEMLALGRTFLAGKGVSESRLGAELLVAHALELDRLELFLDLERPLTAAEVDRGRELLTRRSKGEPVAYLTGKREFYGRDFAVGPGVLVPRPETEHLVDLARERAGGREGLRVGEVGAGSGCVAVTLALELAAPEVVAVERSAAALDYARRNAETLGASVELLAGDGPEALPGDFDLLLSNPPYVRPETRAELPVDVREFEPAEALFTPPGEPDFWLERLLDAGWARVRPGGSLLVELGHDQAERARELAGATGGETELVRDLAGVERVLAVRRA